MHLGVWSTWGPPICACVPALLFEAIPFDHQSQNWRKFLNPNWCLLLVQYWLALMTSKHLWKAGSAAKKGWPCLPKYFLIWCSQGPALAAVCVHLHNYNFVSLLRSIVGNRWYPLSTRAVMSSRWVYTSVNIDVMKREISKVRCTSKNLVYSCKAAIYLWTKRWASCDQWKPAVPCVQSPPWVWSAILCEANCSGESANCPVGRLKATAKGYPLVGWH